MNITTKQQVIDFLGRNPDFLREQAAYFGLKTNDAKIVSFTDVQLMASQDKVNRLEEEIFTLIENAKHNQKIIESLFSLNIGLIQSNDVAAVFDTVSQALEHHFNINAYTIKLCPNPTFKIDKLPEDCILPPSHPALSFIEGLTEPLCTHYLNDATLGWLPSTPTLQSFIQLPLYISQTKKIEGVLIIGSANPKRFTNAHDTIYVEKISEAIAASLNRLLFKTS